jgi:hypothetical protein
MGSIMGSQKIMGSDYGSNFSDPLALNTLLYETKKNFNPNKRTILSRKNEEILRWRTSSTSIEYRRNNDRTTART